jgi:LysM repeat protein
MTSPFKRIGGDLEYGTAEDFRNGAVRQRLTLDVKRTVFIRPLVKAAGLREVHFQLGDGPATASSDGGWSFVSRPKTTGFTSWEGRLPYVMTIPLMLDGFATDDSVEGEWEALRSIFRNGVGPERQPSPISITGAVPLTNLIWVIQSIEPTSELRRPSDTHRTRIAFTLTVMQFIDADVITAVKKSPAAAAAARKPGAAAPATRTYVVKKGDTLSKIAASMLGSYKRYTEIAKLNGIRDPNKLSVGQRLKIPG